MKIMQGDSYAIPFDLTQNGSVLTPAMVVELEVTVGESLTKTYSTGSVGFDDTSQQWYFRPTQAETLSLDAGEAYTVIARVRDSSGDVKGVVIGTIEVDDGNSTEVI